MTAVIAARGLGKRYGSRWALADCTLAIPSGQVVGLVGPNGAGKTTLLHLATGLLAPTTGTIEVAGGQPAISAAQLARVGFVAQDTPAYAGLSIAIASFSPHTAWSPGPAANPQPQPPSQPAGRSSPPVTRAGGPRCSSASTGPSMTHPGPSHQPASKTWSWPT